LHALAWLSGGIVSAIFTVRFFGSAVAPKSSATLFGWTIICFGMLILEVRRKISPKTSKEFSNVPVQPSVFTIFFRSMKKAGVKFSRNADALFMDMILSDHAEETVTADLILACFGDLYARGKIRPKNFAAAPPGDDAALQKALKKLSSDPDKSIYTTSSYDGSVLIRVNPDDIHDLNAALAVHGVEFTAYNNTS